MTLPSKTPASQHRPKTAALLAYAEDALSPDGRRRLERHLFGAAADEPGCDVCQKELAAIRLYDGLVDDVEAEAPEVDFSRMELKLAREAQRISVEMEQVKRPSRWPLFAAAAAAALLLAWLAWPAPAPQVAERPPAPAVPDPADDVAPAPAESPALMPVVTLASAAYRVDGQRAPLVVGETVPEGARVATEPGGAAHVRLLDGTGFALHADAALSLTRAREDGVELTLERGAVSHAVTGFAHESRYVVLAGGYEVEVVGTRFVVAYVETELSIDLREGALEVRPPEGETLRLEAPARWRSGGAAEGGAAEGDDEAEVAAPWALSADEPRTRVSLSHPDLVRWAVDGAELEGEAPIALAMRRGEHEVRGWDARGRLHTALLRVGDVPVEIDPGALVPEAPRVRPGNLTTEQIAPVLQRGRRLIQRCYETALRRGGTVQSHIRLRVSVGHLGEVTRAQVLGLEGNDEMTTCIGNYASRWTFPPPGGPVTFEVPLTLSATQ